MVDLIQHTTANSLLVNSGERAKFLHRDELEFFFFENLANCLEQTLCSTTLTAGDIFYITGVDNDSFRYVFSMQHDCRVISILKYTQKRNGECTVGEKFRSLQ